MYFDVKLKIVSNEYTQKCTLYTLFSVLNELLSLLQVLWSNLHLSRETPTEGLSAL